MYETSPSHGNVIGGCSFIFLFFIFYLAVKLLQGFHLCISVFLDIQDALCGSPCPRDGCHIGNPALDCSLAQIAVVMDAFLSDFLSVLLPILVDCLSA